MDMFGEILIINGVDYGYILLLVLFSLLFFVWQLWLCKKSKRPASKLIPLMVSGLLFLLALATGSGMFGDSTSGFIDTTQIFVLFFAIIGGTMLAGTALAWAVHWLTKKRA